MATYNKPDWKERTKSLTENDFFVDFDEPTVESDPPAVEPAEQLKTWICWYDGNDIGTVEAATEYEADLLMQETYCDEYFFDSWDHDFGVTEATEEDLRDLGLIENIEEPDNAVVDCKVNSVIAHCEDEKPVDCEGKKKPLEKPLTEGRAPDEIRAEIEKLQQELAQAEVEEKKASYGSKLPTQVWVWDMYLEPADKGTWTSAELYKGKWDGTVFETKDKALAGAWTLLGELEDEGELYDDAGNPREPDDYYIEAFTVPVSDVDKDTLSSSGLDHLID